MITAIREDVEEYHGVADPVFAHEVFLHGLHHVHAFIRAGRAGRAPAGEELEFVRARGAQRARELLALDAPSERVVMRSLAREGAFVVARHGEVIGIAPVEPHELRAALLRAAGVLQRTHAVTLRAGVSTACTALAELGRGYVEARRALGHAGVDESAVRLLEDISLFDYLAATADETAHLLLPPGIDKLSPLAETLRAYADCDLNVARAAELLNVHANTIHYRLRRVQELTGRDPRGASPSWSS